MRSVLSLSALLMLAGAAALAQGSSTYPPTDRPQGPMGGMRGQGMMMNMDANQDGTISRDEFLAGHQQADVRFAEMDSNKDGALSRDEWMSKAQGDDTTRTNRFRQLDSNGDGRISHAELEARRTARFDSMDANRDGSLTQQEMQTARMPMHQRGQGGQ